MGTKDKVIHELVHLMSLVLSVVFMLWSYLVHPSRLVLFPRCGIVTLWRTSSWARWFWQAQWRTPQPPRGSSWGRVAEPWPTRCLAPSPSASSPAPSSQRCDLDQLTTTWVTLTMYTRLCHLFLAITTPEGDFGQELITTRDHFGCQNDYRFF